MARVYSFGIFSMGILDIEKNVYLGWYNSGKYKWDVLSAYNSIPWQNSLLSAFVIEILFSICPVCVCHQTEVIVNYFNQCKQISY